MENSNELLKVLIEKTVDNGTAIQAVKDQIRELPKPEAAVAGLEQRIEKLERRLGESGTASAGLLKELQGQVATAGKDIREFKEQMGAPGSKLAIEMSGLNRQMEEFAGFFNKPARKEVHYRHFVGRAAWGLVGVLLIAAAEAGALAYAWHRETEYEKHDLLWRAAKMSDELTVSPVLDTLERRYEGDAVQFQKDVVAEEERRAELIQRVIQEQLERQRIEQLQKEKRKVGGKSGGN